jgi:hypothetical protein
LPSKCNLQRYSVGQQRPPPPPPHRRAVGAVQVEFIQLTHSLIESAWFHVISYQVISWFQGLPFKIATCVAAVRLEEGGALEPLAVGAFLPMTITQGTWRLEGDALKFDVKMSGMTRGDIELPEAGLYTLRIKLIHRA